MNFISNHWYNEPIHKKKEEMLLSKIIKGLVRLFGLMVYQSLMVI